jgi:hypothetical protein
MEFVAVSTPKVEQGNLSLFPMSIWHRRFGHAHVNVIQTMATEGSVIGFRIPILMFTRSKVVLLVKVTVALFPVVVTALYVLVN